MLKRMRKNKKGFTLAELLIVVAIIGVLVAISIPIFTSQLEKSREAVDEANLRNAYAELSAAAITGDELKTKTEGKITLNEAAANAKEYTATVNATQTDGDSWTSGSNPSIGGVSVSPTAASWTVTVTKDTGECKIEVSSATKPANPKP